MSRGLKFIPTPDHIKKEPIWAGFSEFSRKIKLSYFFHGKSDNKDAFSSLFREASSFEPDDKLIPNDILDELQKLKAEISKINALPEKNNIPHDQSQALNYLKKRQDVIFKKADKGNCVVIMERENYITEALRQLNNENYYRKLDEPFIQRHFRGSMTFWTSW